MCLSSFLSYKDVGLQNIYLFEEYFNIFAVEEYFTAEEYFIADEYSAIRLMHWKIKGSSLDLKNMLYFL